MNAKNKILPSFAALAALSATAIMSAQQQVPARQRDTGSTLQSPSATTPPSGTTAGTGGSTNSNDPGATTPKTRSASDVTTSVNDSKLSHRDRMFFEKAAKSGLKEVQVSQAVLPHLGSSGSRDFAQTMINDHQQANEELKALAAKKGVMLPPEDDKFLNKWSAKTRDVDDDYLKEMKGDHKDAVDLFEKAAKSDDPDVAAFAQKTLPTLQHHLSMLETESPAAR